MLGLMKLIFDKKRESSSQDSDCKSRSVQAYNIFILLIVIPLYFNLLFYFYLNYYKLCNSYLSQAKQFEINFYKFEIQNFKFEVIQYDRLTESESKTRREKPTLHFAISKHK